MLCLILIVGGLLIMIGQHDRSEALFYYFRLEDQVPETHLLRLIEKHISFAFVREKLKANYSDTGRPSIDPELLLRIPAHADWSMHRAVGRAAMMRSWRLGSRPLFLQLEARKPRTIPTVSNVRRLRCISREF